VKLSLTLSVLLLFASNVFSEQKYELYTYYENLGVKFPKQPNFVCSLINVFEQSEEHHIALDSDRKIVWLKDVSNGFNWKAFPEKGASELLTDGHVWDRISVIDAGTITLKSTYKEPKGSTNYVHTLSRYTGKFSRVGFPYWYKGRIAEEGSCEVINKKPEEEQQKELKTPDHNV